MSELPIFRTTDQDRIEQLEAILDKVLRAGSATEIALSRDAGRKILAKTRNE